MDFSDLYKQVKSTVSSSNIEVASLGLQCIRSMILNTESINFMKYERDILLFLNICSSSPSLSKRNKVYDILSAVVQVFPERLPGILSILYAFIQPDANAKENLSNPKYNCICTIQWYWNHRTDIAKLQPKHKSNLVEKLFPLFTSSNQCLYSYLIAIVNDIAISKDSFVTILKTQKNKIISHIASSFPNFVTENDLPVHYVPPSPSPRAASSPLARTSSTRSHFSFDNVVEEKLDYPKVAFFIWYDVRSANGTAEKRKWKLTLQRSYQLSS